MAGIAFHPVLTVALLQPLHMDHGGIDGQHLGGVADIGMIADFFLFDAALHHFGGVTLGIAPVIGGDGMDADWGSGPFLVQLGGNRLLAGLVGAMIANQYNEWAATP